MTPRERRLRKLEVAHFRHSLANAGAPYGVSADELLEEARRFFALPLAGQLAELDTVTDAFSGEELDAIRAILIREYRPTTIL